jgi:hypothetical protein
MAREKLKDEDGEIPHVRALIKGQAKNPSLDFAGISL